MNKLDNNKLTDKIVYETDWLGSEPVFYNVKTNQASKNINEVILIEEDLKFHSEGLYNYLEYGYSVFEQTPLKDIKFLPPASQLIRGNDGKLFVKNLDDPVEKWINFKLTEKNIIDLVCERVQKWEKSLPANQEIILPLSGGYDSRFLLWCLKDKEKVRAFTYGISKNQNNSTEVVYANALVQHYNLNWKQIHLGNFHNFFDEWDKEFGISTHAHGMYHLEFYKKINQIINKECGFLSGIFGDVWAGNVPKVKIQSPKDLIKLSYAHGLRADSSKLKIIKKKNNTNILRDQFWINNNKKLSDYRYQIIYTVRQKMILISYLMRLPRLFGFKTWSPFLDIDIAMAIVNLPEDRRINRKWQREFFQKEGLDLESKNIKINNRNFLDLLATKNHPLKPLDINLLNDFFEEKYLKWINRNINLNFLNILKLKLINIPKIGRFLKILGARGYIEAYSAYLCLKPIEKLLKKK